MILIITGLLLHLQCSKKTLFLNYKSEAPIIRYNYHSMIYKSNQGWGDSTLSNENFYWHTDSSENLRIEYIVHSNSSDSVRYKGHLKELIIWSNNLDIDRLIPQTGVETLQFFYDARDHLSTQKMYFPIDLVKLRLTKYLNISTPFVPFDIHKICQLDSLQYLRIPFEFLPPEFFFGGNIKGIAVSFSGAEFFLRSGNFKEYSLKDLISDTLSLGTDLYTEIRYNFRSIFNTANLEGINIPLNGDVLIGSLKHDTLSIMIKGRTLNSRPDGKWYYLINRPNDNFTDTLLLASFNDGKRHGKWYYWSSGAKRFCVNYNNGSIVSVDTLKIINK